MKKTALLLTAAFLFSPFVTSAHENLEACAITVNPAESLACFDNHFSAKVNEAASKTSKWEVRTETSPLDDSQNVFLKVTSTDNIRGRLGSPGPMVLNIMCRENTTDMSIYFNGLHMSDYQYGNVTYRIDKEKAQRRKMVESTSNQHLGLWGGNRSIPFVKALFGHSSLLIEATPTAKTLFWRALTSVA